MGIVERELPEGVPPREDLMFKAVDLAGLVAKLLGVEEAKKASNEVYNTDIKVLRRKIASLSHEIQAAKLRP